MFLTWAAIGAGAAVLAEALMRRGYTWSDHWHIYIPLSILVSLAVYKLLGHSAGWLPGIVAFSAATATLRIVTAFAVLREPLTPLNLVSAAALAGVTVANLYYTYHS